MTIIVIKYELRVWAFKNTWYEINSNNQSYSSNISQKIHFLISKNSQKW